MERSGPSRPAILIVDDDRDLASTLAALLRESYDAAFSGSWAAARLLLRRKRYDLVILDVFLPDASVLEALPEIREIDLDYPVILMSGNVRREDALIERVMRLGVDAIVKKPFELEEMLARVRAALPGANGDASP